MKIQRILQFISTVAVDHDVFSLQCHTLILNFTQNQKVAQTFKHWYHSISDHLSLVWFSSLLEGKLDGAIQNVRKAFKNNSHLFYSPFYSLFYSPFYSLFYTLFYSLFCSLLSRQRFRSCQRKAFKNNLHLNIIAEVY